MPASHNPADRYPTPQASADAPYATSLLVRKSRFLAQTFHAATAAQARAGIAIVRDLHSGASHNCWAYAAGAPGSTAKIGCSDDGEPHGTAGKPMLNVLLHSGIGQICVVVTRWFGGIKLGTGGLARAYQDAVLENLKTLPCRERVPLARWKLCLDYQMLENIRKFLTEVEGTTEKEMYHQNVELVLQIPLDRNELFLDGIARLSNGLIRPEKLGSGVGEA